MKIRKILRQGFIALALVSVVPMATSCDDFASSLSSLSDADTVAGLKEALGVGIRNAVDVLSSKGYISEAATKIGLPEQAVVAFEAYNALQNTELGSTIASVTGFDSNLESNLVQLFNDAATDAAPQAASIFADEITGLSIDDGKNILFGGAGAATQKLRTDTYQPLQAAFHPTITNSMNNVKIGSVTATKMWEKFAQGNNKLNEWVNSSAGKIAIKAAKIAGNSQVNSAVAKIESIQIVNPDISDFVTGKALDGLFYKVEQKENDIRTNVASRTSDLLRRVFGQLD